MGIAIHNIVMACCHDVFFAMAMPCPFPFGRVLVRNYSHGKCCHGHVMAFYDMTGHDNANNAMVVCPIAMPWRYH